ncbi:S41 family peptidase [Chitinophaga pendula]|uniref:S41 family peptidase n=1 Tax=Chitinophaga TaxID=79328 RepID=UPI000BB05F88|nr:MULTISPECIES: S41 family peptidase [Chitinophaga]ASZ11958.1 hypothetical protein CK934_13810 [Chitinophaga sp. MD30]UCJ05014.1 S41 family peptidase [Chitinophaga pendula]
MNNSASSVSPWHNYLCLLLCLCYTTAHAQWKAISYTSGFTTKWDLTTTTGAYVQSPVCFPDHKDCQGIIVNEKGTKTSATTAILAAADWQTDTFFLRQLLPSNKPTLNYDKAKANISCYTRNVKKLLLVLMGNDSTWHFKDITIDQDGFQLPLSSFISTWDHSTGHEFSDDNITFNSLTILYQPAHPTERSDLIISDLTIGEINNTPTRNVFAWIDSLTGHPQETYTRMFDDYSRFVYAQPETSEKENTKPLTFEDFGRENGYLSGYVTFIPADTKAEERKLLAALMKKFAELYPFYQQRGINKKEAIATFNKIFSNTNRPYASLLADLQANFKRLYPDPHLGIILPSTPAADAPVARPKNGPLRLKTIGEEVVVAAILNDRYRDSIPLGAKVIAIDDKPVSTSGDPNQLLFRKETEILNISILADSNRSLRTFHIPYTTPVRMTKNFLPAPEIRLLPDNTLVFRIASWKGETYYKLLNIFFAQQDIKGMIIDLRGNGGGYSADVLKTLSLFTNQEYSLGRRHYPWFEESILISPARKEFRCRAAKVIILTDKNTACASEIFILGMKKRPGTFVLGDTPTMGAVASATIFRLPSGLTLQLHTNFRQFIFDPAIYTEGKGIEPDIWVAKTHARDLAPYEDKLLKHALQLIRL